MIAAVADTHTVVWYLLGDRRLSNRAKKTIEEAATRGEHVAVSAITLAELIYLIEKDRVHAQVLNTLLEALQAGGVFVEALFGRSIAQAMQRVSRAQVPDLPDRMIAATGVFFGVPVITVDARIRASDIETIW